MKKFRTLSSFAAFMIAAFGTFSVSPAQDAASADKGADKAAESKGAVAVAIKGTPKVDGDVDDVWKDVPEVKVDKIVTSESTLAEKEMATAMVKLLWDADHLYALWNVTDPKLSANGSAPHEQDSIELFIDELNQKEGSYQEDDVQYRVSFEGELTGGEGFDEEKIEAVAKKTDTGYLIEMSIKLAHAKRESGTKMGLELQVNDNAGNNAREAVAKWNHDENDSYLSTSDFGNVELKD